MVEMYDLMKNEWTNVGWLIKGVSGAATVFIGDEIFIIGGFNIESEEPNGDVQIFNVKTGKCRICEELRTAFPLEHGSACVLGDTIFFAGEDKTFLALDTKNLVWIPLSLPMPKSNPDWQM